ncbi:MAG: PIN domain-containing protein [Candidatus Bathyarchaeia archaeon]
MPRVVLDTSIIIEYIDKEAEFQDKAKAIFASLIRGELEAIVPHPILAEAYYVSAKIYRKIGMKEPHSLSSELVEWLFRLPSVTAPSENKDLAVEAGKAKLQYCLALTDCYVLAASKVYNCKALFRKPESEMSRNLNALKRAYQLVFLSDYR